MKLLSAAFKLNYLIVSLALIFLFGSSSARATTVRMPSDEELIVGARAIVRGRVLSVGSAEEGGRIYTYTVLRVQEVLKGVIGERRIVIKEEGGQVGSRGQIVWGTPQFLPGEEVLLYLSTGGDGSLRVHEMFLGKFTIIKDLNTGRSLVRRSPIDENVSVINDRLHGIAEETTETMELGEYTRMIRRKVKATRERFERFERQYFQDIPLRAEPIEYRALAARDSIQPQFTFIIPSLPMRWFEPDENQSVLFNINLDGAPNPQVADDIAAAMNVWSTVAGCSLRVAIGSPTTGCYGHGGGNAIVFNNCDSQFNPTPDCSSIIARGGVNWDSSQTRVVNGVTFVKIYQGFISFNPYSACSFEHHCDIQEIATHELGHALGLGHSRDITATMAGTAHFDGRCALLKQDDIYAIKFLYPAPGTSGSFLNVTTEALPTGYLTSLFEQQLEAAGGVTPFTWSLVTGAGPLPTGFVLLPSGLIRGTPGETGTWSFTVKVTDAVRATAQKTFTVNVLQSPPPFDSTFVSQSVPTTVQAGQSFEANVRWRNQGSQTWNSSAGLRLVSQNPANNTIWGGDSVTVSGYTVAPDQQLNLTFTAYAPPTNGTYDFQWRLYLDGVGVFGQASANVQIVVTGGASPVSIIGPASFDMTVGTPFNYQLAASGGATPYAWSIVSGSLPSGLSLHSGTGVLSGTPTVAGSFSIVVQAADAQARTAQRTITLNVAASPPPAQFEITTSGLPAGVVAAAYNAQLATVNGAAPYVWSIASGSLPAGVSLNPGAGALTGTPTAAGSYSFTARVTDAQSRTAQRSLSLVISPSPVEIMTSSLPSATVRTNYNTQLAAAGGTQPYLWSVSAGALPAGVSLNSSSGTISGAAATVGNYPFTIMVRDSQGGTATKQLTANILPAPLSVESANAPVEGTKGLAFAYLVNATGGTAPYNWTISGGALPTGLTLSATTGLISGVPTAGGIFNVAISVRDQKPDTASATLQMKIIDPATVPRITNVQYKAGKRKLIVFGERIASDATLRIDGAQVTAKFSEGSLVVKRLDLVPGNHQIVVINSSGNASQPFTLSVQ